MDTKKASLIALDSALWNVRRAFRRASKPGYLKDRMSFLKAREEAQLLGRKRSSLTASDIHDYVSECGGHLDQSELAYFMPRICEVIASGERLDPTLGWAVSLNCLSAADFPRGWPLDHARAVQRFVEALLVAYVEAPEQFEDVPSIGELFCMAGYGGIDMGRLMAAMDEADQQQLARALAHWIDRDCWVGIAWARVAPDRWREDLHHSLWTGEGFQAGVLDWLLGLEPWSMISAAAERETDPQWRDVLVRVGVFCRHWPEAPRAT